MKSFLAIILLISSGLLHAQKVGTGFDFTIDQLIESGLKKFADIQGKPTDIMADAYFQQHESNLLLEFFKYNLITEYSAGKMSFFTGVFVETNNRKKALKAYEFLVTRVEQTKPKCCTFKKEPGIDLENEKKTYFKPFARPKEYANLQMIVALESVPQKNGKLKYSVLLYVYASPIK